MPKLHEGILYDPHEPTSTSTQLPYPPSSLSPEVNNHSTRDGLGGGLAHDKSPNRISQKLVFLQYHECHSVSTEEIRFSIVEKVNLQLKNKRVFPTSLNLSSFVAACNDRATGQKHLSWP